MDSAARTIVDVLGLLPHPEGGWYAETWRDRPASAAGGDGEARPASTAIYFLLAAGERSHWHRVDATEIWHHYAGGPLEISIAGAGGDGTVAAHRLGTDLASGERPQVVVPADAWQSARPLGAWALVGCTVTPGFEFAGFELAPPDWSPTADAAGTDDEQNPA